MADYLDPNSGDEDAVPKKLMVFVGLISVLGAALFVIAALIDRKHLDPNIDPSDPTAFEQVDADEQETPDLWVQKRPWDDAAGGMPTKPLFQRPEDRQAAPDQKPAAPTSNPG